MRTPDINRVNKALAHAEAIKTLLNGVKFEIISGMEYTMKMRALENLRYTEWSLKDMLNCDRKKEEEK